jgi:hypothetical protein
MFALVAALLAAAASATPTPEVIVHSPCPITVGAIDVRRGTGLDYDSDYAYLYLTNPGEHEYIFTVKFQVVTDHVEVSDDVGSSPVLPHSKGWYREFLGSYYNLNRRPAAVTNVELDFYAMP